MGVALKQLRTPSDCELLEKSSGLFLESLWSRAALGAQCVDNACLLKHARLSESPVKTVLWPREAGQAPRDLEFLSDQHRSKDVLLVVCGSAYLTSCNLNRKGDFAPHHIYQPVGRFLPDRQEI